MRFPKRRRKLLQAPESIFADKTTGSTITGTTKKQQCLTNIKRITIVLARVL
ncbi:MAG TPA: hypothetical protein VM571_03065 [Noviherbaspirillum sp.]|nr:hypothetical protein [Noviherbaspirillum sp.]